MTESNNSKENKVEKEILIRQLHHGGSPFQRYKAKVLGTDSSMLQLIRFELAQLLFSNLGGGLGYLLRRVSLSSLFKECGKGLILGKGTILRTPSNMVIGDKVAVDDQTLLDGGTEENCTMIIGDKTLISKGCIIQAKTGPVTIGRECDIGAHVIISSATGINLGENVLIAGNCYIGGARYFLDDLKTPIMYQGIYSRGPVTIGKDTWIGASVTILDGVTLGRGCVIGAGSLVTKDIPDYAIAVGCPAKVVGSRKK